MTQEQERVELQTQLQESQPTYTPVRQTTQLRLNAISQVVENLVTLASRLYTQNQSLSIQVRTTSQEQIRAEDKINQSLDKAESRSGFAKFFVGPNYRQLKTVRQEMEQNRLRIQQLNQIMSQIANTSDQTELANQIKIMETQNTRLEEQLNQDTKGFALFGWLSKLMSGF
jgi:vacuolar-type H+-ATPase subunit I/STV1